MKEPFKIELLKEVSSKNDFIQTLNDPNMFFVYMRIVKTMAKIEDDVSLSYIVD